MIFDQLIECEIKRKKNKWPLFPLCFVCFSATLICSLLPIWKLLQNLPPSAQPPHPRDRQKNVSEEDEDEAGGGGSPLKPPKCFQRILWFLSLSFRERNFCFHQSRYAKQATNWGKDLSHFSTEIRENRLNASRLLNNSVSVDAVCLWRMQ